MGKSKTVTVNAVVKTSKKKVEVIRGKQATLFKPEHGIYLLEDGRFARQAVPGGSWTVTKTYEGLLPKALDNKPTLKLVRDYPPSMGSFPYAVGSFPYAGSLGAVEEVVGVEGDRFRVRWGPKEYNLKNVFSYDRKTKLYRLYDESVANEVKEHAKKVDEFNKRIEKEFQPIVDEFNQIVSKMPLVGPKEFKKLYEELLKKQTDEKVQTEK